MGKLFDKIFESVKSRYQVGGFLTGDTVKFVPKYKKSPTYKAMHAQMQKELDELVNSGLNIKVVQVQDNLSGVTGANQYKLPQNAVIAVAGDHGGGRHFGTIAVSSDMIELLDFGINLPPIPDQFRREDNTDYKPREWNADQQNITRVSDKGNGKNTPTHIKLAGESTKMRTDNSNLVDLYEAVYAPEQ